MTGLLDRLRGWIGAVFGTDRSSDDASGAGDAPSAERQVVHRDDRPLETPGTMGRPTSPSEAGASRDEGADAETGDSTTPDEVSIPDAEATTTTAERMSPNAEPSETSATRDADAASAAETPEETDGFACSVCGTTVEDPSAPCPLCRSTDVGPVVDASTEAAGGTPVRGGRTTVSTADDDEAVERLRDVSGGE
jgi:hypothetical protein